MLEMRREGGFLLCAAGALDFVRQPKALARFGQNNKGGVVKILSTLTPPRDGIAVLVFDTRADGKNLVTTLVVGDANAGTVSPTGQVCIDRLGVHHVANYPAGKLHIVQLAVDKNVASKVRAAIARAADGDALIFWCADSVIYDKVYPVLGFSHPKNGFQQH